MTNLNPAANPRSESNSTQSKASSPSLPTDTDNLHTILDWVRWGSSRFNEHNLYFGHGTSNAWDEAKNLLLWAIHQSWDMFDTIQGAKLSHSEKLHIARLYTRRIDERIPAAYLMGVAWFAGYPYKITPDVLVPRSPIAELILKQFQPWLSQEPQSILDLCTGSGCIGIACAHEFPSAQVDLGDISAAALDVAKQNIAFHQLEDRVSAYLSDGLSAFAGKTYDLIVSNPPYVDAEDFASMPAEYRAEPTIGLVSGDDGLDFTRRLLAAAAEHLNEGGALVVEVGNSWVALEEAFPQLPFAWPEFENGGHGVFVLTREQLLEFNPSQSGNA